MKKLQKLVGVLVVILFSGSTLNAQTTVLGVKWDNDIKSSIDLIRLDPSNGEELQAIATIKLEPSFQYVNNTLHHDVQNDILYFQSQRTFSSPNGTINNGMETYVHAYRASTGKEIHSFKFDNAMAPFVISENGEIGFIAIEKEFNGYGNNDDNISLSVFKINTGKTKIKTELPSLSFSPVSAPFVGETVTNNQSSSKKNFSLSSTCHNSKTGELLFCATDVMGINRLFRISTNTGAIISSNTIDVKMLDMAFDAENGLVHALYIKTDLEGAMTLNAGLLNLALNSFSQEVKLRDVKSSEFPIADGSVQVSENGDRVYITKKDANGFETIYSMDAAEYGNLEVNTAASLKSRYEFTFPYKYQISEEITFKNVVSVHPNPASGQVTVSSLDKAVANYVIIRNDIGQVVKEVSIENGEMENNINISGIAQGIYTVEVQTNLSTPIIKKLIIK